MKAKKGSGVRSGPARMLSQSRVGQKGPQLSSYALPPERLPTTPESKCDNSATNYHDSSPCIHLHGQPLNTPARQQRGVLAQGQPQKQHGRSTAALLPSKGRKNSFQRAVDVTRETLENTRQNAGYSTIDIVKEVVRVDGPRPQSPSNAFLRSGPGERAMPGNSEAEEEEMARAVKFSGGGMCGAATHSPPYYDTHFPLRSIMKAAAAEPSTDLSGSSKEQVVVKKLVYSDDLPAIHPTDLLPPPKRPPKSSAAEAVGGPGSNKSRGLGGGPARRVVR